MVLKIADKEFGDNDADGSTIAVRLDSVSKWRGIVDLNGRRYVQNELLQSLIELSLASRSIKQYAHGRAGDKPLEPVLKGISVTIERGSIVGVVDIGGQSRYALLRILANCESPSIGTVSFFGKVAALQRIGNPLYGHMTCQENLALEARFMGLRASEVRAALARVPEFSGAGHILDLPSRRVDRAVFQDLGLSFQCCLDFDVLVADELLRPRLETVVQSWTTYLQRAPDAGKTVILSSRDVGKLLLYCTHLLLIDQTELLAYGPAATIKAEFGPFLDRASAASGKAVAQPDMLTEAIDDEDDFP